MSETPSQTAGPYLHIGLTPRSAGLGGPFPADPGASMAEDAARGEHIAIRGRVLDGLGEPVRDAVVEAWQADAAGRLPGRPGADPALTGWGRSACDSGSGEFGFDTIKPGGVPWPDGRPQAPHVTLWIVARGINLGLHTRLYFPDEAEANARDPLLARIDPPVRARTLVAWADGPGLYRHDVRLQGEGETVFLDM